MSSLYYKIFPLIIVLLGLTGCTLTTTQIPLNYYPTDTGIRAHAKNTLTVGEIKDTRGDDPTLLMQKVNMYNDAMSGKYVAGQPIGDVLQKALRESLSTTGYKITPRNANMTLSGELLNLELKPIMGFFSGNLKCKMQVNFKLTNNQTGEQVWSDILNGHSNIKNLQLLDSTNIRNAFNKAADNLIQQLETSPGFRRALND